MYLGCRLKIFFSCNRDNLTIKFLSTVHKVLFVGKLFRPYFFSLFYPFVIASNQFNAAKMKDRQIIVFLGKRNN